MVSLQCSSVRPKVDLKSAQTDTPLSKFGPTTLYVDLLHGHARVGTQFIYDAINPLAPDAHYSERQDKPLSLQIQ